MTEAEQKVIDRLKEIGGAGWLGRGVKNGRYSTFASYCKDIKRFWGEEAYNEWQANLKKYGITNLGVWCSNVVCTNLANAGIIEGVPEVPGAWMLTEKGKIK